LLRNFLNDFEIVPVTPISTGIIIIIIIIIGKDTISFMQGTYTYIPETNHVPKERNVVAILSLLFMVPISLVPALVLMYLYISTFRSMCAVPNMTVFCSSLTSWFPSMVLTYYYYYYYLLSPLYRVFTILFPVMLQPKTGPWLPHSRGL
jgi:hypothetical protein